MSVMRIGVLLCLLLAGVALCTEPAAPAGASSVDLAARDTTAFHKLISSLGGPASYPETRFGSGFDASRIHDPSVKYLTRPAWRAIDAHPFLSAVLPGVTFAGVGLGTFRNRYEELYAIGPNGRLYRAEDLNSLLLAEGFSFDSTEFLTMAKIAVLFEYFLSPAWQPDTEIPRLDYQRSFCSPGLQAFPSIEFRSFTPQQTAIQDAHSPFLTEMRVVCSVDGVPETTKVAFRSIFGTRRELDEVAAPPRPTLYFGPGRVREPIPAEPTKQSDASPKAIGN
jgi:hypothetical protein